MKGIRHEMSDRDYYNQEISKEEEEELKRNADLIIKGKLPAKKIYFEKEAYCDTFRYCYDRLTRLKECVQKDMENPDPLDFLYPNEPLQYQREIRAKKRMDDLRLDGQIGTVTTIKNTQADKEMFVTPTKSNKQENSILFYIPLVMAILFFISIFDLPYEFYTIFRFIIFFLSFMYAFRCYMVTKNLVLIIASVIIGIIWNPILPIYLDKETWVVLDVIGLIVTGTQAIVTYKKNE